MKLSVITINRNNAEGLRRTMMSVLNQSCSEFEYIVIDGASTDKSVEVMDELAEKIAAIPVKVEAKSEPDAGLYNAMNKGVRKATGEYVLMLNSGDEFADDHVVASILPMLDGTDIIQGNTIRTNLDGMEWIYRGYGRSEIDFIDVQQGHFPHQASFCRRVIFDRFGFFDESYRIDGDTVFFIKALGYGDASFKYVDTNVCRFEPGGRSSNANDEWENVRRAEFDRWSSELFSKRLWNTCLACDKKQRLYDKLHRHRWAWKLTMVLSRLIDVVEK